MELKQQNSITITYLSKVSFASLNGADKEVDNINPIKKVTLNNGQELPYISSQAIRRALRDRLEEMGLSVSKVQLAGADKGAPGTEMKPYDFIDDDLFGYMSAKSGESGEKGSSNTRTSPIRIESLLALTPYQGDLDFGTNYMGKKIESKKVEPNIFETEIHSGFYRGTILIELDRVGKGEGFKTELDNSIKAKRVISFIDSFRNLWSSGRQTRFLADISPKFIAAAYMKVKNPIFLEAVNIDEKGNVDIEKLNSVISDYDKFVYKNVFAGQEAIFEKSEKIKSLKEGFEEIEKWIKEYFGVK